MSKNKIRTAKVKDIKHLLSIEPAVVKANATIRQVLEKIIEDPQTRHVYVVDDGDRLIGSIRLNAVLEYIFPFEILWKANSFNSFFYSFYKESPADFMDIDPQYVTDDTTLSDMILIMKNEKVNELPVVDDAKRLIGEANILKAIKYYLSLEEAG